jgi:hypothetical protein
MRRESKKDAVVEADHPSGADMISASISILTPVGRTSMGGRGI